MFSFSVWGGLSAPFLPMGRKETEMEFSEPKKQGRPPKDKGQTYKRGRPKKDDIIDKPFVPHTRSDMKPENQLAYAKKTVRSAENAYKKYSRKYPNPLNLEAKDLCKESVAAWKYVFSLRGYTGDEEWKQRERAIKSSEEVLILFESFCSYIRDNNFVKQFTRADGEVGVLPIVPSQANFARWLGVSRFQITDAMRYCGCPEDYVHYKNMLADILSEGAMMGIYQTTMTIFSLKNLCDWADRYDDRPKEEADTTQTVEEAKALMESLGYKRLTGE